MPIGSMRHSSHLILTDRPTKGQGVDRFSDREASVDDRESYLSNSQSRCMETMGELTASLAEAYQKINELT